MEKEYNYINNSPIHLPPKGRRLLGQGVKHKSGMVEVHSYGDVLFFDSMDDYINSIDWDWMKNRIR